MQRRKFLRLYSALLFSYSYGVGKKVRTSLVVQFAFSYLRFFAFFAIS